MKNTQSIRILRSLIALLSLSLSIYLALLIVTIWIQDISHQDWVHTVILIEITGTLFILKRLLLCDKKTNLTELEMASWHSVPLHVAYEVLGWLAFVCWSISFYPQVILNFRRKRFPENSFSGKIHFINWASLLLLSWTLICVGFLDLISVWWGWTSTSWCWTSPSTPPIWSTMRLCSSALLFRSSTETSTVRRRFVLCEIQLRMRDSRLEFEGLKLFLICLICVSDDTCGCKWCCFLIPCCSAHSNYSLPDIYLWC